MKVARPEFGSASAETSAIAFLPAQGLPGMLCQAGAALYTEHPLPLPLHAASVVRTPVVSDTVSVVPPTPMTFVAEAGNSGP